MVTAILYLLELGKNAQYLLRERSDFQTMEEEQKVLISMPSENNNRCCRPQMVQPELRRGHSARGRKKSSRKFSELSMKTSITIPRNIERQWLRICRSPKSREQRDAADEFYELGCSGHAAKETPI